jgi:hypothetical protein
VLEGNPDLYGPVWIATTVVVILFLTGTISQYLAHQGKDHFAYDFKLLSGGAGMVYGYTGLVPTALWAVLKWYGSESANLLECICLYGYANLIWIPVALISCSPINRKSCAILVAGYPLTMLKQSSTSSSSLSALPHPPSSFSATCTPYFPPPKPRRQKSFSSSCLRFMLGLRLQSKCCFSLLQVPWGPRMELALAAVQREMASRRGI